VPTRLCLEPRCPEPAIRRGRCAKHNTARNRETRSANKAEVYNRKRWKILRSRYLFEHPLCECGCGGIAEDVHHKKDIQAGGDPWAWDNLEALTHACHSKATRRSQATR
jgi:5-methylcytosine-specific restriction endonuclease McrA